MNNKSILMPHSCQIVGWWLFLLTALLVVAKIILAYTTHNINVVWYLAKSSHLVLIISLFFITLSKEKFEDEMISGLLLKALGLTGYVFFVVFLLLSLALELHLLDLFKNNDGTLSLYLSELFLIILRRPVLSDIPRTSPSIQKGTVIMKNTVRVERAILDITQQKLADAVGVSRNTIISIESGRYLPSTILALKIARHFGKPVESIFQLDEND